MTSRLPSLVGRLATVKTDRLEIATGSWRMTGYQGRTNPEMRDAGLLIFGMEK